MEASECCNITEEAISKFTALVIAGFGETKELRTKHKKSEVWHIFTHLGKYRMYMYTYIYIYVYIYTYDFTDSHSPKSIGTFSG